jgi:hypothetical protein
MRRSAARPWRLSVAFYINAKQKNVPCQQIRNGPLELKRVVERASVPPETRGANDFV